jgi:hypothetical protein
MRETGMATRKYRELYTILFTKSNDFTVTLHLLLSQAWYGKFLVKQYSTNEIASTLTRHRFIMTLSAPNFKGRKKNGKQVNTMQTGTLPIIPKMRSDR